MDGSAEAVQGEVTDAQTDSTAPPALPPLFHHVSPWKFVFMSVTTFGLYDLYWSYKCWWDLKLRRRPNIWPVWRTIGV